MFDRIKSLQETLAAKEALIESQNAQIAELKRQATTRYQQALSTLTVPDPVPVISGPETPQAFRFLDLPAELRAIIYDLCLVKGKVYIRPRPESDQRYNNFETFERPEWQLLLVCHQIRSEAAKSLFSKNHFVFSHSIENADLRYEGKTVLSFDMPSLIRRHVRSASITLDVRTVAKDPLRLASLARQEIHFSATTRQEQFMNMTNNQRLSAMHLEGTEYIPEWEDKCESFPKAKYLEINIKNCYCPLGCHRLIDNVTEAIPFAFESHTLEVMEVLGTKSGRERGEIVQEVKRGADISRYPDWQPVLRFKTLNADKNASGIEYLDQCDFEDDLEDEEIDIKTVETYRGVDVRDTDQHHLDEIGEADEEH